MFYCNKFITIDPLSRFLQPTLMIWWMYSHIWCMFSVHWSFTRVCCFVTGSTHVTMLPCWTLPCWMWAVPGLRPTRQQYSCYIYWTPASSRSPYSTQSRQQTTWTIPVCHLMISSSQCPTAMLRCVSQNSWPNFTQKSPWICFLVNF